MSVRRAMRASFAAALVVLLATACGGGGGASATNSDSGLGKTQIKVGMMPIIDTAPFYIAKKRGFFKEAGLDIKTVTIQGGAEAVPKLQQGALDISFGNYVSVVLAQSKGLKMHIAAEGYNAKDGVHVIMAMPDSGIRTVKDLEGKTIAVNTKHNVSTLLTKSTLKVHGVDPKSVKFVEVPFPEMLNVLKSGEVDAAYPVEPFISAMKKKLGAHLVVDVAQGPTKNWPIAGYFSTKEFYEKYPKTVQAFADAMQRAQKIAHDQKAVEKIVPTYTKIDPETMAVVSIGEYPTTVDASRIQRVADLMLKFGLLDEPVDVSKMIA